MESSIVRGVSHIRPLVCGAIVLAVLAGYRQIVKAQSGPSALITRPIDETELITLTGNTRPEANAQNDRGLVASSFPMDHLLLQLRRSPERERALKMYVDELNDPKSPNYHRWLTARQLGRDYGVAPHAVAAIKAWLRSHGFTVNGVNPNGVIVDFSGTAGQVREAFHTEIHQLEVNGVKHMANMSDPRIPLALAPAIVGVVSLNNFMPRPMHSQRAQYTFDDGAYDAVVPADLATIYNLKPLFNAGYSGQGQTIAVVEDTNVYTTADWSTFRSVLGLASAYPSGSFTQVHPAPGTGGTCANPGANGDDAEAILDAEWSSAAAPNAAIERISCADTSTNFGGFIALQNLLTNGGTPPAIVSISYGESEASVGAAGNAYINGLYQQAALEGVSVFVSAGDQGAAGSDGGAEAAQDGITVNSFASTPYDVAVGGTDFGDTYAGTQSTYWSATNGSNYGSAVSYVPEIPWNDSCASELIAEYEGYSTTYGSSGFCNTGYELSTVAASGGPSGCATGAPSVSGVVGGTCAGYAKPPWQSVFGNPPDGVRDVPDVALFAANGIWGHYYVVCWSDRPRGGTPCTAAPDDWSGFGGTSVAAPIMAATQALINQKTASRHGNPNPEYYSLASNEYGASGSPNCNSTLGNEVSSSCIFYDVTLGDMDVDCVGSNNCYKPPGSYGVLSTSNSSFKPAY
jgi:subtilase family serine protease